MCDYSLMARPNRLAVCGEELVVYKFELGTKGLAAVADLAPQPQAGESSGGGLFQRLKRLLFPPVPPACPAVCVPPGARLLMRNIPEALQKEMQLAGPIEEVTFTEIDTAGFRDAVRFPNGTELLLQRLLEGQRFRVLELALDDRNEQNRLGNHDRFVRSGSGR